MIQKFGLILVMMASLLPCEKGVKSGEELIHAMHKRYEGKWYPTLSFEQQTIRYGDDGEVASRETWYEAMELPNKLTIKFNDWNSGNGLMIRNDSLYAFKDGQLTNSQPMLHPLLVLGFSVYCQPPEKTIADLAQLDIDLTKFHKRMHNGKKVYVVGAEEGDETSSQFWIEKDRMLFVRLIQNYGNGRVQDIRFNKYQPLGGGWVAPEVLFYANGQLRLKEVYDNIRTPELGVDVFDPNRFVLSKWKP